jgi:hypothetical protein
VAFPKINNLREERGTGKNLMSQLFCANYMQGLLVDSNEYRDEAV